MLRYVSPFSVVYLNLPDIQVLYPRVPDLLQELMQILESILEQLVLFPPQILREVIASPQWENTEQHLTKVNPSLYEFFQEPIDSAISSPRQYYYLIDRVIHRVHQILHESQPLLPGGEVIHLVEVEEGVLGRVHLYPFDLFRPESTFELARSSPFLPPLSLLMKNTMLYIGEEGQERDQDGDQRRGSIDRQLISGVALGQLRDYNRQIEMSKDKVRVIREEAESHTESGQNPYLSQLSSIALSPSLLTEIKSTQITYKLESITSILQNLHHQFVDDTKSLSVKQQQLIAKVENSKFGALPKLNIDLDKTVKRFGEFLEIKREKEKYRTLTSMMNKALEGMEGEVDALLQREIQKRNK